MYWSVKVCMSSIRLHNTLCIEILASYFYFHCSLFLSRIWHPATYEWHMSTCQQYYCHTFGWHHTPSLLFCTYKFTKFFFPPRIFCFLAVKSPSATRLPLFCSINFCTVCSLLYSFHFSQILHFVPIARFWFFVLLELFSVFTNRE